MSDTYPVVKLGKWNVGDLDGQPVRFNLTVKETKIVGKGVFQITEVRTGAYVTILALQQDTGRTSCLDLNQGQVDVIRKSGRFAGFICGASE